MSEQAGPDLKDDTLRIGDAAALLGVDATMVFHLIEEGALPAEHFAGQGIRLRRSEVQAYSSVR